MRLLLGLDPERGLPGLGSFLLQTLAKIPWELGLHMPRDEKQLRRIPPIPTELHAAWRSLCQ